MKSLTFVAFLGIVCLACKQDQLPANQSDNAQEYLVAYNVAMNYEGNNYDIWTVDPETLEKKNITNHPDVAWTYLSHDDQIFFISDRDTAYRHYFLYQMDNSGSAIRQISDTRLRDSWMGSRNNGKELIVNPHSSVDSSFYIISTEDGVILSKVTSGMTYQSDPTFSPDGGKIVFRGAHKKSKLEDGFAEEIYIMKDDGSNLKQLSQYPKEDTTASKFTYLAGAPRWHPTQDLISYQSFQNGKYSLYAVTSDGSKQWKLTKNEENEGWHDWRPDGKWLAIETFDAEQTEFHVMLLNWDTKERKILTDTSYQFQQAPVFVEIGE